MADRSLLSRATEGTQAPTPGYLYLDISKNVASSPMACQDVATYLTRRLSSKNNANIKFKCLKVITKICESPITKGQFKRTLAQDAAAMSCIKEALQYRGPPDPARGDEPYQRVRTAAKEALDAVYSDAPTSQEVMPSANYGGGGGGGPRRMEGIGNPMFKDPRLEDGYREDGPMTAEKFVKEAGQTIAAMYRDPLAKNADQPQRGGGSGMQGFGSHTGGHPPGRSQLQAQTNNEWNMASNRGPGAVTGGANPNSSSYYNERKAMDWASKSSGGGAPGGVGGSWGGVPAPPPPTGGGGGVSAAARVPNALTAAPAAYGMTPQTSMGQAGTAISDGQYEKQLILELCPPGGMKAEPPPDKLQRFSQSIPSLNPDLVCPALLDCLEEGQPWIIRAKALCVMETCITVGVGEDGVNRYADFFFECRGEIDPLANHARAAIHGPARRVLELLGVSGPAAAAAAPSGRRPTRAAPAAPPPADLLDFGAAAPAPAPAPPPAPVAPPAPAPAAGGGGSLFGGLTVQGGGGAAPRAAAPAAPSLLDAMSAPAPAAAPASGFGFISTPTSAPAEKKEAPPAAAPSSGFGFMQETAAPAAPAAPAGSGFGFMQETAPAPAAAPPAASGFGFMADAAATTTPVTAKPTFDPLSQGYQPSPTTAQQQQTINPAQLQAMYAQQNMMMMQQQMQQMQMAMAMHGGVPTMPQQQGVPQRAGSNPNVMGGAGNFATSASFSFLDAGATAPKKKEDKKFDFVQDAMKKEKK